MSTTENDTAECKITFNDCLLVNSLKKLGDDWCPNDFAVKETEREAVNQNDPCGKRALLTRLAKTHFSEWTIPVFNASFILSGLAVASILFWLYWVFSGGTLSGTTTLGDKIVNVGPPVFFLIIQYAFLFLTLTFIALTLLASAWIKLHRSIRRRHKIRASQSSAFLSRLCCFGSLLGTIVFGIQRHILLILSFVNSKTLRKNLPVESLVRQFRDKPFMQGAISGILSNLIWTIFALIIVGAFFVQSYGYKNHFYWKATYPGHTTRMGLIASVESVVLFCVPWYEPLTDEEIFAVVSRDVVQPQSSDLESAKWTGFVIHSFAVAIIIRLLLVLFHFVQFRRMQRRFIPDLEDEFYRNLIAKITDAIKPVEETRTDENDADPGNSPTPPPRVAKPDAPGPAKTFVFMYDLDIPHTIWDEIFPGNPHVEIFGVERCMSQDWEDVRAEIRHNKVNVERIVIAFDMSGNVAYDKLLYVKETAETQNEMDKTYVLLSRSETLRKEKGNAGSAIRNRVSEWQRLLAEQTGISPNRIIDFFDHEKDDPGARTRLSAFFFGKHTPFQPAGKYAQASAIILSGIRTLFTEYTENPQSFASAHWDAKPMIDEQFSSHRDSISRLYAEERQQLRGVVGLWRAKIDLAEMKRETQTLYDAAAERVQQFGEDSIKESIAWGLWLGQVHKTLKPRSLAAFGGSVLGLAAVGSTLASLGPVGIMAAPYVVSACGGGAGILGFFAPEISKGVFQMSKGLFRKKIQEMSDENSPPLTLNEIDANFLLEVSAFMTSLASWATVHELHGLPPEQIAEYLSQMLEPIENAAARFDTSTIAEARSPGIFERAMNESQQILASFKFSV